MLRYREPGTSYRQTGATYGGAGEGITPTLQIRARISKLVGSRSPLKTYDQASWTYDDYAVYDSPPGINLRALIVRRQGWPIPEDDPIGNETTIAYFTDTRLYLKTNIYQAMPTEGLATMYSKARIWKGGTPNLALRARIVRAGHISLKANIRPQFYTVFVPAYYTVQSVEQRKVRVVLYVKGSWSQHSLGAQACILQTYTYRTTAHFLAANSVGASDFNGTSVTRQTLSFKASIHA